VWTYDNTWFWGIGCGKIDGVPFGYNIGYGFGDTSNATENMLFYNGKCHKLDVVDFGIPENVMDTWTMTSSDNRWNMTFKPFFNDRTDISVGVMSQHADKLFGLLNGTAILDDGTELKIEKAKKLLRESYMSVSDISELLSFDNPNYFSKTFKRITGSTPTKYRNMRKEM
jgi:hypothetical protein